jgi:hypothetical protein
MKRVHFKLIIELRNGLFFAFIGVQLTDYKLSSSKLVF